MWNCTAHPSGARGISCHGDTSMQIHSVPHWIAKEGLERGLLVVPIRPIDELGNRLIRLL
jgi:hypothetical protein